LKARLKIATNTIGNVTKTSILGNKSSPLVTNLASSFLKKFDNYYNYYALLGNNVDQMKLLCQVTLKNWILAFKFQSETVVL